MIGAGYEPKRRGLERFVGPLSAGPAIGGAFILLDLVEVLAGLTGVVAGDAGAAEAFGGQADGAGDGLDREITEAVGAELLGHPLLRGRRDPPPGRSMNGVANSSLLRDMSMP